MITLLSGFQPVQPADPVILKRPEHPVSRRNIDPDALKILYRLHRMGFIAYLTGGAVRDMMLGKRPKDFDIVTDARPGQIKKRFRDVYIIGRRFRLAHIHFHGGKIIEVATFRKNPDLGDQEAPEAITEPNDIYGTPREDAFRRDITINALFYDAVTASVIDYVGGLEDLKQRRIRVIGDPGERFREDPVRIWRVVRYAARVGFDIEEATEQEIISHRHLLANCSGARFYEEFNKDLIYIETRPVVEALRKYGILRHILGRAGEEYEADLAKFSRLCSLLVIEDRAKSEGFEPSLEELYTLFFWPWLESAFAGEHRDLHATLKKEFIDARMKVTLPRSLRVHIIEIMIIVGKMTEALRTGHMRWSMRGRSQYGLASRLFFLIEKGRAPGHGESFESLFREAFPSGAPPGERRRRRRR
jgi:poly(A) polymerase